MTVSFDNLIAPLHGGRPRTKKDVARAILDITHEDRLFHFAASLAKHEVVDRNHTILRRIAHHLSTAGALHKLRLFSKRITQLATSISVLDSAFNRLYVTPMYVAPNRERNIVAFTSIASSCTQLVARFRESYGNHEYPPGVIFRGNTLQGRNSVQVNDWQHVLARCPNINTLIVITETCPTGLLWNRTSTALTALRTAFEEAGLKKVTTLRWLPVDMLYIGQFKWNGPSFGNASPMAAATWSRITNLEVQMLPLREDLNKLDHIQTIKMFNAWLQALAPRLKTLKLCYLGGEEGAHPFALLSGLVIKTRGQPDMGMPVLEELWLGRVKDADGCAELLETLAPQLKQYVDVLITPTGGRDASELKANLIDRYRVLMYRQDPNVPVTFGPNCSEEVWRTVYIKWDEYRNYTFEDFDGHPNSRTAGDENVPYTQTQTSQRSVTSPSHHAPAQMAGRPSTSTSNTVSSSKFPPLHGHEPSSPNLGTTTEAVLDQKRLRQTSLPSDAKPGRKRGSSGLSNLFAKIKNRPKSEPTSKPTGKPEIKLVGETPHDQLPKEFCGTDTNHVTFAQTLSRYRPDGVEDLSLPPTLKLSDHQQVGQFRYAPGTLFQAGTGVRVPTPGNATGENGVDSRPPSRGQPTPEQIRKAFAKMGLTTPGKENMRAVPMDPYGWNNSGKEELNVKWNRYQQRQNEFVGLRTTSSTTRTQGPASPPAPGSSWETIAHGGSLISNHREMWGGRRSSEEQERFELPASSSHRSSKRRSQLEDVLEEDDGEGRRLFAGF